jgi:hypothetical protein
VTFAPFCMCGYGVMLNIHILIWCVCVAICEGDSEISGLTTVMSYTYLRLTYLLHGAESFLRS